jgi:LmbE family N-acetylglucosaminyl deacetylase
MRWIYLSPHFDDAALSCGGLICEQTRQGTPAEIWTIFAGSPPSGTLSDFARTTHSLWGTGDAQETVALRRAEDREAAARLGASLIHFDFLDCIYRLSRRGLPLYPETVFAPPHRADRALPRRIAHALRSGLLPGDVLVCPLALGGHVDHVLVRRAAESLGRPLHRYADVPYVLSYPNTLRPAVAGMRAERFELSEEGAQAWLRGVAAYGSQVDSLFKGSREALDEGLLAYWGRERGLLLWHDSTT